MAIADSPYADPSALLKLYLQEPESRRVALWRAGVRGPLAVTPHGRVELVNGIALALYRRSLEPPAWESAMVALDDDFNRGRYTLADLPWRATLKRASELSRDHSRSLGTRTLDVIHVASALELGLRTFLSFDLRQQKLARAAGLKLATLGG